MLCKRQPIEFNKIDNDQPCYRYKNVNLQYVGKINNPSSKHLYNIDSVDKNPFYCYGTHFYDGVMKLPSGTEFKFKRCNYPNSPFCLIDLEILKFPNNNNPDKWNGREFELWIYSNKNISKYDYVHYYTCLGNVVDVKQFLDKCKSRNFDDGSILSMTMLHIYNELIRSFPDYKINKSNMSIPCYKDFDSMKKIKYDLYNAYMNSYDYMVKLMN